ncbi:MAG TPA: DUF2207 domain-containing protein [Gemmatimonadaceae bacterium]|nr:DUF2207 domain-containing protein [Gemmatimonadaceae bacterium]
MKRVLFLALFAFCAVRLPAQERILSYDVVVEVKKDASVDVTERIAVHAEGNNIRRGIYRDFPTRYTDRFGNRVKVDLNVTSVEKNGAMEPWFTERLSNGVRINTGNDDFLSVPADYTYTIRYRVTRELGFFADHDELYWNAIGAGWVFPIEKATAEVRLPEPVPIEQMHAEAYTGPQGSKGTDYIAEIPEPGIARFRMTRQMEPYEPFTIVVTFPKGLVPAPNSTDRARWLIMDNRGILAALIGLVVLLVYMYRAWCKVGRDPHKGIIIARYEPRDGHTPAGLRYLEKMGYDMRCFTGDVLSLAVAGKLRISEEKKLFKNEWSLEKIDTEQPFAISNAQTALYHTIFRSGDRLVLKNTNASTMQAARDAHKMSLDRMYQPEYFKRNTKQAAWAWVMAIVFGAIAFIVSGGTGIPVIIGIGVITFISLLIFTRLVKAPTPEGRKLLDEIEGLKLYMSVAEKQELRSIKGPDEPVLDAGRYEQLLPYAVALDVEDAWTEKFTAAAGAAAAAQAANNMTWYHGHGPISNLGSFSNSIGSSLSSSISSASTPPGSSSGSGGGGSSGGGGGGGGGGGR